MSANQLIQEIKTYNPEADFDLLNRCYEYGQQCHNSQRRKSGEPYFSHCVETAKTLISLKLDLNTICAGLLHDTIEDVDSATERHLADKFGGTIAALVQGVTKISKYPLQQHGRDEQRQAENYLKLLLATAQDVRVILIKLADRLHNMETLQFQSEDKKREIAKETLEIYAPIANRLGISRIKNRLEDLSFKYLLPYEYKNIAKALNLKLAEREAYAVETANHISAVLQQASIDASVRGRPKNIYSIYQKINEKGIPFEEIYDLIGMRVLVNRDIDCYTAAGAIHTRWPHVPERFKDFIGLPKANGYQSLHTTILDHGRRVEIQIRTHSMHKVAEEGIAAHWLYKEGAPSSKPSQNIFKWLKQTLEDIQELKGAGQFIRSFKTELFGDEVYVFTPKGDIIALPSRSTPIDFAYKIHTQVGNTCIGAEVNGMVVSLRYRLQNGDQVKINTNANGHPGRDWLRWVKTARARNKIKQWFKEQDRTEAIELGKRLLQIELRRSDLDLLSYLRSADFLALVGGEKSFATVDNPAHTSVCTEVSAHTSTPTQQYFQDTEDFLEQIGNGELSAGEIINLVDQAKNSRSELEVTIESQKPLVFQSTPLIELNQIDLTGTRVMKCCRPIPGDEIIGYIKRGGGVSVHRTNCSRLPNDPDRLINIEWKSIDQIRYAVDLIIECHDRPGILGEITTAIAGLQVNIREGKFGPILADRNKDTINCQFEEGGAGFERLTVEVTGLEQLDQLLDAVRNLEGVTKIVRA